MARYLTVIGEPNDIVDELQYTSEGQDPEDSLSERSLKRTGHNQ
jgi:hypothetical protein